MKPLIKLCLCFYLLLEWDHLDTLRFIELYLRVWYINDKIILLSNSEIQDGGYWFWWNGFLYLSTVTKYWLLYRDSFDKILTKKDDFCIIWTRNKFQNNCWTSDTMVICDSSDKLPHQVTILTGHHPWHPGHGVRSTSQGCQQLQETQWNWI